MAHNCTYDALNESKRAQELTLPVLAAMIAAMVTGGRTGTAAVAEAGIVVAQGILSTYSIEVESRADRNGVTYLLKANKYNPVGMLTFMERLAAEERSRPRINMGIYQTHPLSVDRVTAIADQLAAAGTLINRRAVTKWDPPKITEGKLAEQPVHILNLWEQDLLTFNWAPPDSTVVERGETMVKRLTDLLTAGADGWEFAGRLVDGGAVIEARGVEAIRLYPQDASLQGITVSELLTRVQHALDSAFFRERLKRRY
jgi:hypothetical protein